MIINLIRAPIEHAQMGEEACHAEAPGVPAHRVAAAPFEEAEREVRRRCLRSLADRANPPTAVVFVRTWEHVSEGASAQAIAVAAFPEDAGVRDFGPEAGPVPERLDSEWVDPLRVPVSAEQVAAPPRRGRKARPAP